MWWNADETRYLHRTNSVAGKPDRWDVIDVATGTATHTGIPFGRFATDGGFDPVNGDVFDYLVERAAVMDTVKSTRSFSTRGDVDGCRLFHCARPARGTGGTLNWLDASGRDVLMRYDAEPSVHVYDRQNVAAGPCANPPDATNTIPGGYVGITPDGQLLISYDDHPVGYGGMGEELLQSDRALARGYHQQRRRPQRGAAAGADQHNGKPEGWPPALQRLGAAGAPHAPRTRSKDWRERRSLTEER